MKILPLGVPMSGVKEIALGNNRGISFEGHSVMTIRCAWCGKVTGHKDGQGITGTTATICPECEERETDNLVNSLKYSPDDQVFLTRKGAEEIKKRLGGFTL